MITRDAHIKLNKKDQKYIRKRMRLYSCAFHRGYIHSHLLHDPKFIYNMRKDYKLSAYEYNCLVIDIETKIEQVQTNKTNLENEIMEIQKEIEKLRNLRKLGVFEKYGKLSKKSILRTIYKKNKKLERKNKALSKDITFGTVELLRTITHLSNQVNTLKKVIKKLAVYDCEDADLIMEKELELYNLTKKLKETKHEYSENRMLPLCYVGSKKDKHSNRYFIFNENEIIYKPVGGKKIRIPLKVNGVFKDDLNVLFSKQNDKLLPITVKLTDTKICITYEEEILGGYGFDLTGFKEESKGLPKEEKSELWVKYKREQEERMMVNKLEYRHAAIDLNPLFIGVCILDKVSDDPMGFKVVKRWVYDLTGLDSKKGKNISSKLNRHITDKRKTEMGRIYVDLFKMLTHYGVSHFYTESLTFKDKDTGNTELNRKVNNIWNLNYQMNLIKKHCGRLGIILDTDIQPAYSSFIGNIMNEVYDPAASATELCRRGIYKWNKNSFYPVLSGEILDTAVERILICNDADKVNKAFPDVQSIKNTKDWKSLYKLINNSGLRYRRQLDEKPFSCSSRNKSKKGWFIITF